MNDKKEVRAIAKHIRISPLKARRVANVVRGKELNDAIDILRVLPQKGARLILKVVNSAVANAVNNSKMNKEKLELKSLTVNEGAKFVRFQAKARGRINRIIKRTSHIEVIVGEIGG